jgi:hypothetical protein
MVDRAEAAARTKQELPDIINALLEESLGSAPANSAFLLPFQQTGRARCPRRVSVGDRVRVTDNAFDAD